MPGKKSSEEGYTLVETVVAMALFLSVLIPLVTTVGNVMFDRKALLLQKALAIAQTEMSRAIAEKNYSEATRMAEDGLVLARTIRKRAPLIEVIIAIRTAGEQPRQLVTIKKLVIDREAFR
jgi:type II secretory pathway pseudopilin PulG